MGDALLAASFEAILEIWPAQARSWVRPKCSTQIASISSTQIECFLESFMVFIPQNVHERKFDQFSADNLDMMGESLDEKGTFHVTQMTIFQQSPVKERQEQAKAVINRGKVMRHGSEDLHRVVTGEVPPENIIPKLSSILQEHLFCDSTQLTHPYRQNPSTRRQISE